MSNLKKKYNETIVQKEKTKRKIDELKKNHFVEEYIKLCKKESILASKEKKLYTQIKTETYTSCNHIWVITDSNYDYCEGRSYKQYGCIKCGLNQGLLERSSRLPFFSPKDIFTKDEIIMLNCMNQKEGINVKYTDICCKLDVAKNLYLKIKNAFPNIDDETILKYFEIEINNSKEGKEQVKVKKKTPNNIKTN